MTDTPHELSVLRHEVRALLDQWRAQEWFVPRCDAWLRGYDLDFSRALAERGWIGITWPTRLGGGARSNLARLVVTEELLMAGAPVAAHWISDRQIGPAILRYGSPRLQEEFLPAITSAQVMFCLGMSEPEAGSDLAAVRTRAERVAGGWHVTGTKIWTSQAHRSTHAYVLARTGAADPKHENLTEFVLDLSAPGVTVRPIIDMAGEHHFNEMIFDGVFVPEHWTIGEPGNGWHQVTEQLAFERGGPERLLSTFPLLHTLIDRTDPQDRHARRTVGRLAARLLVLRRMAWEIAAAMDAGAAPVHKAAMLKGMGTTFEREVVEAAGELLDTEPDPTGAGAARLLADGVLAAPGFSIRGGTTEILATIVAREEVRR
ncbi:acyl-CoA dehydrogenase family protein [Salinactinospora qingdaonensis]|uniref:Acyl-CoA dehydrogenase family protein n=1 Tax=Salinactinospora qingdaonensis TaxID=702744 RepID=A0ABP7F517_9ACTN